MDGSLVLQEARRACLDLMRGSVVRLVCFASLTFISTHGRAAETSSTIEDWEQYVKAVEKLSKSLTLTPLVLSESKIGPGGIIDVYCSLVSASSKELTMPKRPPPFVPGAASAITTKNSTQNTDFCRQVWGVRRKGGRQMVSSSSSGVSFDVIRPGDKMELTNRILYDNLKLSPGEWEVVLSCVSPTGGKILYTRTASFTVVNAKSSASGQDSNKSTQSESEIHNAILKKLIPALRLGDVTLSSASVKRGSDLTAGCRLVNSTSKDIEFELPPGLPSGYFILMENWHVRRLPEENERIQPLGGDNHRAPGGKSFRAGDAIEFKKVVSTADLEPGSYELVLEVRSFTKFYFAQRRQRFRVEK